MLCNSHSHDDDGKDGYNNGDGGGDGGGDGDAGRRRGLDYRLVVWRWGSAGRQICSQMLS